MSVTELCYYASVWAKAIALFEVLRYRRRDVYAYTLYTTGFTVCTHIVYRWVCGE